MAIPQLTDEQVHSWTVDQKDRWWLENVYRGDMPQLTLRSALTGFVLGGLLSATNLYIGAKTGWSLGVGITSVILAFSLYRALEKFGICRELSILENNCSQSIATAAGYMTSPLTSSMAAYMITDGRLLPWHQLMIWNVLVSVLGVLFAFPIKRRFINDEQHPFPEGQAAAVVMDALHQSDRAKGVAGASALLYSAGIAGSLKFLQSEGIQEFLQRHVLQAKRVYLLPESFDGFCRGLWERLSLAGVKLDELTIAPSFELAMIGAGGLMGIRAASSLLIGAIINYVILAPWMIQWGQIVPRLDENNVAHYGMKEITRWALWPGVTCMVVASFVAFFSKPRLIIDSFRGLFSKKRAGDNDVLQGIEFPLWISIVGVPVLSLLSAFVAHSFFGVDIVKCLIGLPLTFVLTLVAANSTALTSITPIGATSKITQLFYGVVEPRKIHTNIITASLTAEVVSNASNLLMDIKPGYMLGAKPRQQAIGHLIGIMAGSLCSVPLFFVMFTQQVDPQVPESVATIQSDAFPMPSATVWKAIAETLMKGVSSLPHSVQVAAVVAAVVGLTLEASRLATRGRFPLSPVAMGLAFVIEFKTSFAMFLGALIFWLLGVERPVATGQRPNFWKQRHEPICAGLIAGASLMGILDVLATNGLLTRGYDFMLSLLGAGGR